MSSNNPRRKYFPISSYTVGVRKMIIANEGTATTNCDENKLFSSRTTHPDPSHSSHHLRKCQKESFSINPLKCLYRIGMYPVQDDPSLLTYTHIHVIIRSSPRSQARKYYIGPNPYSHNKWQISHSTVTDVTPFTRCY